MSKHASNAGQTNQSRRNFLKVGAGLAVAGGASALGLNAVTQGTRVKAMGSPVSKKRLVIINLLGGNDGLNTVIPSTLGNYATRRGEIAIDDSDSLALTGGPNSNSDYRLNPELPALQSAWNDGDLAIINKVGYPRANLSHFTSEDIWSYGVRDGFAGTGVSISGWLARYADTYLAGLNAGMVSIGFGKRPDFSGGSNPPLIMNSIPAFSIAPDWKYQRNHALRIATLESTLQDGVQAGSWQGPRLQVATNAQIAFDLSTQVQDARTAFNGDAAMNTYENVNISRNLRDIATFIHGGFDSEIFYTGFGGFDTHSNQTPSGPTGGQTRLMFRLNDALDRFIDDCKTMGVWDDTVVITISEFGRRNFVNGSAGTDHGHGNCMLILGGSVNGGMYGADPTNDELDENWLGYDTDFRRVFIQLIENHLGKSLDASIFPEALEKPDSPGAFV